MYDRDVAALNAAMRASPETFVRGALFAVLSARQMIVKLPEQMAEVDASGDQAGALFGWKRESFHWLQEHGTDLWAKACAAETPEAGLRAMLRCPGLGIIKGAFVLQMIGHDIACLDSRNMAREGRSTDEYLPRKDRPKRLEGLIARYVAETRGRARELWDTWCADAAEAYGRTADQISKLHVDTIAPGAAPGEPVPIIGTAEEIPF